MSRATIRPQWHRPTPVIDVEALLHARWSLQQISARLGVDYPHRPRDARVSRNRLPVALCPDAGGAPQGTDRVSAFRTDPPSPAWPKRPWRLHQRHGAHCGPAGRGRRPRCAWPLGRRPGRPSRIGDCDAGGAPVRYVMLLAVVRDRTSARVCALIVKKIQTLPRHLAVSLTWDRGLELAGHR
jgi:hypothetical protein